jgi:hypothetical protein
MIQRIAYTRNQKVYSISSRNHMEILLDLSAKVGREDIFTNNREREFT